MCGLRIVFLNLRLYFSAICFATACLCLIVSPIGVSSLPLVPGTSHRSLTSRFEYFS